MTASVPQIMKGPITFTLAGASYAEDLVDAELRPVDPDTTTVITLDGIPHTSVASEAWELRLKIILDHDSVRPGLAYYLNANKGTTVAAVFNPHGTAAESASLPKWTFNVTLKSVPTGGEGQVWIEHEVILPVQGIPVRDATP